MRKKSARRQIKKEKPRLIFGPQCMITTKYICQSLTKLNYEAKTLTYEQSFINSETDFDYSIDSFFNSKNLTSNFLRKILHYLFLEYYIFIWSLSRFDIFHFHFDGGFLMNTPLKYLEMQLLHLASKKVVVMPYGSDVYYLENIHSSVFRHNLNKQYPQLIKKQAQIARQLNYMSKRADFIITAEVVIFHSPNHRILKGTDFLIQACNELKEEGIKLRLDIIEKIPNEIIRELMDKSDIMAEQFGMPWYGLNAIEGMSLSKPVLSDLSDNYYTEIHKKYTGLDECPIVITPPNKLKENLRMLIQNPNMRRDIGIAGRKFVEKFNSYEAIGKMWEIIYRKVWYGENLQQTMWHPDRVR
jgi:glycosyltransferase involved in cell wall biosynthesis